MNEGLINTSIGIKGIPKIAEEIQIARDIEIFLLELIYLYQFLFSTGPKYFHNLDFR